jgi:hypothetical protein
MQSNLLVAVLGDQPLSPASGGAFLMPVPSCRPIAGNAVLGALRTPRETNPAAPRWFALQHTR